MKFFKNTELAKVYNVSEKSVRNWIVSAQEGKLDLDLYTEGERNFVANTTKNSAIIESLVDKGQKYKNKRAVQKIVPSKQFYETYSAKQIFDIISNITIYKEVPLQYNYVDGGAYYWDKYTQRLASEQSPNMFTGTLGLLKASFNEIDRLLEGKKRVNIVDLGPGNGQLVRSLLEHLSSQGRLNRYIAIDISKEMLEIAEKHIKEQFGDRVHFEGHVRDFSHERFDDLFAEDNLGNDADIPLNLVMLIGGTLCNFRTPHQALEAINSSVGIHDLVVYGTKLDTPNSRRFFDFNADAKPKPLDYLFRVVIELLGIDPSHYDIDQVFDEKKRARSISIRPKTDWLIEFQLSKGVRQIFIHKNEPILLWRYRHQDAVSIINQFNEADFDLMQAIVSNDQEYLLSISKIKVGEEASL